MRSIHVNIEINEINEINDVNTLTLSGDEANDAPTGEIYPHAFRDWLLESNIPTSLNVGNVVRENVRHQFDFSCHLIGIRHTSIT